MQLGGWRVTDGGCGGTDGSLTVSRVPGRGPECQKTNPVRKFWLPGEVGVGYPMQITEIQSAPISSRAVLKGALKKEKKNGEFQIQVHEVLHGSQLTAVCCSSTAVDTQPMRIDGLWQSVDR